MDTRTVTYRDAGRGERQAELFATLAEAEAYAAYEALVEAELIYRADECMAKGTPYAETTVHLYHAPWGDMLAELCVEAA